MLARNVSERGISFRITTAIYFYGGRSVHRRLFRSTGIYFFRNEVEQAYLFFCVEEELHCISTILLLRFTVEIFYNLNSPSGSVR